MCMFYVASFLYFLLQTNAYAFTKYTRTNAKIFYDNREDRFREDDFL